MKAGEGEDPAKGATHEPKRDLEAAPKRPYGEGPTKEIENNDVTLV